MKLLSLKAKNYRILRDVTVDLDDFNLFIGPNASGKSTILDALRLLHEGLREGDFRGPILSRGGPLNVAWKGEDARWIDLVVKLQHETQCFEWTVRIDIRNRYFRIKEQVTELISASPQVPLLESNNGAGYWKDADDKTTRIQLRSATSCALAAASANTAFPARDIASFVDRWGFFDPNPFLLRRDWPGVESATLDHYGRNLAAALHTLESTSPDTLRRIRSATRDIIGVPKKIETRESVDRPYFVQEEDGLRFPVHQMGVSSGTLRMLAMMTALYGEPDTNLLGIEEPENYIHPSALSAFVEHTRNSQSRVQFMVTTHSPLLLDLLNDPRIVYIVQSDRGAGTTVTRERNPEGVRRALDESGFSLGEYHQTKGFGVV